MIRYYKLFDLLNRKGMKKSDLRSILSPKTVAKLSKGEYLSGEVIEKICMFLHCQPGDIMEIVETTNIDNSTIATVKQEIDIYDDIPVIKQYIEFIPDDKTLADSDAENKTERIYQDTTPNFLDEE